MPDNNRVTKLQNDLDASRARDKPGSLDEQRNGDDAASQRILDELKMILGN